MSKKKLNSEIILNELKQGSAFFPEKTEPSQKRTFERSLEATNEVSHERTVEPTKHATNERAQQRTKIRHTFDIFTDQLQGLHQVQLEILQAEIKKPKLGDMVQEALDDYLVKQGITINEPKTERSNERS